MTTLVPDNDISCRFLFGTDIHGKQRYDKYLRPFCNSVGLTWNGVPWHSELCIVMGTLRFNEHCKMALSLTATTQHNSFFQFPWDLGILENLNKTCYHSDSLHSESIMVPQIILAIYLSGCCWQIAHGTQLFLACMGVTFGLQKWHMLTQKHFKKHQMKNVL